MMKRIVLPLFPVFAIANAQQIDWKNAEEIREGVRLVRLDRKVKLDKPRSEDQLKKDQARADKNAGKPGILKVEPDFRPMKIVVMRVNLKLEGLTFTGTGRDKDWGEKMPDYPKDNQNSIIRTLRVRTADFMKDARKPVEEGGRGLDMIVACNSAPWAPWEKPFNHKYGNPHGLEISDGIIVNDKGHNSPMFVIYKSGEIDIAQGPLPKDQYDKLWLATTGFGSIMIKGERAPGIAQGYERPLMPRMTYGLDAERNYLYLVTVDGRQPGWSEGAIGEDLYNIFKDAGAYDVIDMDGGGSATLCYWDAEKQQPVIVNRHNYKANYFRPCGMNMGIYLKK
ncbi:MAG: phosphodiester glycosidase family protein [Lentisphaerae bacterium]|nr:phosphodiester glycosidase family protein [Lentisphaerota bacterium]